MMKCDIHEREREPGFKNYVDLVEGIQQFIEHLLKLQQKLTEISGNSEIYLPKCRVKR